MHSPTLRRKPFALCSGLVIGLLAITSGAWADQDVIGIFADAEGTEHSVEAEPQVMFYVYLLLMNPSADTQILGWTCRIGLPDNAMIAGWYYAADAINVTAPPVFSMGYATGLPRQDVVELMRFVVIMTDSEPGFFSVEANPGDHCGTYQPYYIAAPDLSECIAMTPFVPPGQLANFIVNPESLPNERSTWGGVKALYE